MANRIRDFFTNKTILVTGGTGFVGKVLIEKLLRSCTTLRKIYAIVRPKKGVSIENRFQKIFAEPLFDILKNQHGEDIFGKVDVICGDISAPDLGLSPEDRQKLISEVEIIFHSAATVRFDEPLKFTILLNVRGTKLLLELAKECRKLEVFSYVSTTFCQENEKILGEKFYPPPMNPHKVIDFCEVFDEGVLSRIEKDIRRTSANNYSFSKALAEGLVQEHSKDLPIIVQRPSVVTCSWKEPFPGWIDNLNAMSGLLVGGGTGVLQTMHGRKETVMIDCCPVDVVAKDLIFNTYYYFVSRNQQVFNLTGPFQSLFHKSMKELIELGLSICRHEVAFNKVLWYPNGKLINSRFRHNTTFVVSQLIPAIFLDGLLVILGQKPFLLKTQKKIWNNYSLFDYYGSREWRFDCNRNSIQSGLNPVEFESFGTNFEEFNLHDYFVNYILGLRRYVFKEPDDNIPSSLRRIRMLWYFEFILKMLFVLGVGYYIKSKM